jgi:hypothetical protein
MTENPTPEEALAAIKAARGEVGRSLDYHPVWDVVGGIPVAVMVGGQGLPPPWSTLTVVFGILGVVWMMNAWKARYGWWVNGYGPRNARWVSLALIALILPLMIAGLWTSLWNGPWWLPLVNAVIAWIIMSIGSRVWMLVYRSELDEADA